MGLRFKGDAHRAAADAELTAKIMIRVATELKSRHRDLTIDSNLVHRVMKLPVKKAHNKLRALSAATGSDFEMAEITSQRVPGSGHRKRSAPEWVATSAAR
jgi:DNA polymerase III epsilon subunit-like protein